VAQKRFRYLAFRIVGETIRFSHGHMITVPETFVTNFKWLCDDDDSFSTNYPQKMWKIQKACQVLIVLSLFVGLLTLCACSQGKGVERFKALPRGTTLVAKSEAEVRQALGEPNEIAKTTENRILWKYKPSWKVVPSPKDTLYVEFENGKVAKVFQIK
jgi:hypothetical protein